jgi:pre-mRNA-splicing factor 38A
MEVEEEVLFHGQNPQLLIEQILRGRIYDCMYWKEKWHLYIHLPFRYCILYLFSFALTAETLCDRAVELNHIGGHYSNQKPTEFICLALKLLHLAPEFEIIQLYLDNDEFKYLKALSAFYIRLTGTFIPFYTCMQDPP